MISRIRNFASTVQRPGSASRARAAFSSATASRWLAKLSCCLLVLEAISDPGCDSTEMRLLFITKTTLKGC